MAFSCQTINQTKLYLVPMSGTKTVTILVLAPVGSRYETKATSGLSHFIEHLMFKGTKRRPTTLVLTREIDRLGAEYNAFTSKEYTGYYIKTAQQHLDLALDILSDMLYHSRFTPAEMEREKTVIIEELRMYKDNPLLRIESEFENLFFAPTHPLSWDIGGVEKTVRQLTRPQVMAYYQQFYRPDNFTIVIAGHISAEAKKLVEKYFSPAKEKKSPVGFSPAVLGPTEKEKRQRIVRMCTDQVQLMVGYPSFAYAVERNIVLGVLNTILGGSMSSRLFIKIRERLGLAYMVRADQESFHDAGYSAIRVGLEAKNIPRALTVIQQELKNLKKKGVTARELQDAKTHLRGHLVLSLEDSSSQASWYGLQDIYRVRIKTPEEKIKELEQITNRQLQEIAQEVFQEKNQRLALVGAVGDQKLIT